MPQSGARILVVDDEKDICDILFRLLERQGYKPMVAHNGETALEMIRLGMPDAVLLDVNMPGMDGMEVLRRSKTLDANLPIIIITAWGGIDGAVYAIKEGAFDYLPKPIDSRELIKKIGKALQERHPSFAKRSVCDETQNLRISHLREMMGPSEAVNRVVSEVALVAPSNFSVIIQGETGTGKEAVARAIHEASPRAQAPIIPVDCGAIPESLFESELFGYEKGAFTGASTDKPGKFELAGGGTLFLDEISNMPLSSQIKLLRAIQERSFFRVGARKPVTVDVRIVVAVNVDLNAAVRQGTFSRDLFYRLSEFTIHIPPLRERQEDTIHIATRILKATNIELAKDVRGFSDAALDLLRRHPWQGNVRELRASVRRAVLQAHDMISATDLILESPFSVESECAPQQNNMDVDGLSLKEIVRRSTMNVERHALIEALRKTGGNKAKAARLLQIDYTTIHAKIKQYGIKIDTREER
ncbi:MAG: sigma-54 dependent transcriptional regulator [Pseudomonadota bacterium]